MKPQSSIVIHQNTIKLYYSHKGKVFRYSTPFKTTNIKNYFKRVPDAQSEVAIQKDKIDKIISEARIKTAPNVVDYLHMKLHEQSKEVLTQITISTSVISECYKEYSESILKPNQSIIKDLEDFSIKTNIKTLNDIDSNFFYHLKNYYISKGNNPSYITRKKQHINNFIKHIKDLLDPKIYDTLQQSTTNLITRYTPTPISFRQDEVMLFIKTYRPFSKKESDKIKDLTIISIYTGLSFCDLKKITLESIQNGFLLTNRQKVKSSVVEIPISDLVIDIIKKWNGIENLLMSNYEYNLRLKQLCKDMKVFNYLERVIDTQTGEWVNIPKLELISHKMCRKTFITGCLNDTKTGKINILNVQRMAGWNSLNQVKAYADTRMENRNDLLSLMNTKYN